MRAERQALNFLSFKMSVSTEAKEAQYQEDTSFEKHGSLKSKDEESEEPGFENNSKIEWDYTRKTEWHEPICSFIIFLPMMVLMIYVRRPPPTPLTPRG
jgi:hypothetical protein